MATVLPYPATRRRPFIRRQGEWLSTIPADQAEKHLANQLRIQAETMTRRGIAADLVAAEIEGLEAAIRGEICRARYILGGLA